MDLKEKADEFYNNKDFKNLLSLYTNCIMKLLKPHAEYIEYLMLKMYGIEAEFNKELPKIMLKKG